MARFSRADYPLLGEGEHVAAVVEGSDSLLTVEAVENHVYFYSEITPDRCLALIKELRQLDKSLRTERISRNLPQDYQHVPIWLHIQSGGGNLFSAMGVVDQLSQITTPIFSVVEGFVASAATLISMSCTRRYIQPSAFMLIHQLSGVAWGTYEKLRDEMSLADRQMEWLVDFYANKSKIEQDRVRQMLKRDLWLDKEQCLEMGLVDLVME